MASSRTFLATTPRGGSGVLALIRRSTLTRSGRFYCRAPCYCCALHSSLATPSRCQSIFRSCESRNTETIANVTDARITTTTRNNEGGIQHRRQIWLRIMLVCVGWRTAAWMHHMRVFPSRPRTSPRRSRKQRNGPPQSRSRITPGFRYFLMAAAFAALSLDRSDALRPNSRTSSANGASIGHARAPQAAKWGNQWTNVLKSS
jgi:hypothetical protein